MKRVSCIILSALLFVILCPMIQVSAITTNEIDSQIKELYHNCQNVRNCDRFNGYCGDYTATQLNVLGITKSIDSRNGCDMFDLYKDASKSSGGYSIAAYPATEHSLFEALNIISSNGTQDVYNILVGCQRGTGEDAAYGHSMLIYAIVDGTVFFSESFGFSNIGGKSYAEGQPIKLSISDFCSLYIDSLGFGYEGAIHFFNEHSYFTKCTKYPTHCNIEIIKGTYIKTLPCSRKTDDDSDDIRKANVGEVFTATKLYQNSVGNFWYEIKVEDQVGYVYAGDTELDTFASFVKDVSIKNISAPTSINKGNVFSIKGDISSEYCVISSVYGSIHKGGAQFVYHCQDEIQGKSYSLLNSKIDMAMLFNELPSGSYYYEIDVTVPYYYSYDGKTLNQSEECYCLVFQEFTVK